MPRSFVRAALCGALAAGGGAVSASTDDFQATLWASSCMACHGTDGRAEGVGKPLAGRNAEELHRMLVAYKRGDREATIMHHHARGYTDEELRRIAQHFSRLGPGAR